MLSFIRGIKQDDSRPERDEFIPLVMNEISNALIPALKRELLEASFFSLSAELRHRDGMTYGYIEGKPHISERQEEILELWNNDRLDRRYDQESEFDRVEQSVLKGANIDRSASYKAAKSLIRRKNLPHLEFVELARDTYRNMIWDASYGGVAWAAICDGWIKLFKAQDLNQMVVWIDHIYDLQHNGGSVLDKILAYNAESDQGRFNWLNPALDFKRNIKDPRALMPYVSSQMKRIASYAIFNKTGKTIDSYYDDLDPSQDEARAGADSSYTDSRSLLRHVKALIKTGDDFAVFRRAFQHRSSTKEIKDLIADHLFDAGDDYIITLIGRMERSVESALDVYEPFIEKHPGKIADAFHRLALLISSYYSRLSNSNLATTHF